MYVPRVGVRVGGRDVHCPVEPPQNPSGLYLFHEIGQDLSRGPLDRRRTSEGSLEDTVHTTGYSGRPDEGHTGDGIQDSKPLVLLTKTHYRPRPDHSGTESLPKTRACTPSTRGFRPLARCRSLRTVSGRQSLELPVTGPRPPELPLLRPRPRDLRLLPYRTETPVNTPSLPLSNRPRRYRESLSSTTFPNSYSGDPGILRTTNPFLTQAGPRRDTDPRVVDCDGT